MGPRPSDRGRRGGGGDMRGDANTQLQWVHGLLTVGDLPTRPRPGAALSPRRFNGSTAF